MSNSKFKFCALFTALLGIIFITVGLAGNNVWELTLVVVLCFTIPAILSVIQDIENILLD